MPSPIAHLTAGYLVYLGAHRHAGALNARAEEEGAVRMALALALGFSILPDLDSAAGILLGNFSRYHNNGTHSLVVGAAVSLAAAALLAWKHRHFTFWFLVAAASYSLHILMDGATVGRGVMAFWPLSNQRFLSPLLLFYGLHWSDGWLSLRHVWTALTELAYAGVIMLLRVVWPWRSRGQV